VKANKSYYDIVFVVLVYKNIEVLKDFFKTLQIPFSYHVIVVNSYFDADSEKACQITAKDNDATFIPVKNRGYGSGNNVGCNYALDNFMFGHLIVSNSDIIIKELSYLKEIRKTVAVLAPETRMLNGHRQNPNIPFNSWLFMSLLKMGYKMNIPRIKAVGLAINRLYREILFLYLRLLKKDYVKVFSAHGSFIIFTFDALEKLMPIFNEKMFLYNEELFLAYKCKKTSVPIYYVPKLKVLHLEGASSTESDNSWKNKRESFNVLMEWLRKER